MRPVVVIPPRIEETRERIPIARIGEKSMFPKRNQPCREKTLKYGSVMEEMIFPNLVNFAPGIQVIKIEIRQSIVYMIITAERKDNIV